MKINENTSIGLPLRNLISLIAAIIVGAWFAFGVIERLNRLETKNQLFEKDYLKLVSKLQLTKNNLCYQNISQKDQKN